MAEPVAALLRRSLHQLATEAPASHRQLRRELDRLVIEIEVDGEVFALRGGPTLDVLAGPAPLAGVRVRIPRSAILDLLDGRLGLAEAVEAGRIAVRGALADVVRAHDTLVAYVHAAVRAPSVPGLLAELRAGGPS